MARKKKVEEGGPIEPVEGTVEYLAKQHFDREVAAYEERTGTKVNAYLPVPLTSTPIEEVTELQSDEVPEAKNETANAEGEGEA